MYTCIIACPKLCIVSLATLQVCIGPGLSHSVLKELQGAYKFKKNVLYKRRVPHYTSLKTFLNKCITMGMLHWGEDI